MNRYKPEIALGIDIGGTNVKAGLVDAQGRLLHVVQKPLNESWKYSEKDIKNIPSKIYEIINMFAGKGIKNRFQKIGVAIATPITPDGLVTTVAHHRKTWQYYDLACAMSRLFPASYSFAVDTNAAAYGEWKFGAGRGYDNLVCVFLGTGIGSGIIIDGKILLGSKGMAGSFGHTVILADGGKKCNCGGYGCVETLCSADSIVRRAMYAIRNGSKTRISELCENDMRKITPRLIYDAVLKGDKLAEDIFKEVGYYLGIGLLNFLTVISPEVVVLGGGIAGAGKFIVEPIRKVIRGQAFPPESRKTKVIRAKLGIYSGVIGVAGIALNKKKEYLGRLQCQRKDYP